MEWGPYLALSDENAAGGNVQSVESCSRDSRSAHSSNAEKTCSMRSSTSISVHRFYRSRISSIRTDERDEPARMTKSATIESVLRRMMEPGGMR